MKIKTLFQVATNPNHLLSPLGKKGQEKISLGKRILGISLFTLSFVTGILPAIYLYTAYKKISKNPKTPSAQKTNYIAKAKFDPKITKKNDPYFDAIEKGDLATLQDGLNSQQITVNSYSSLGFPLLTYAIRQRQHEIIDFLLNQPGLEINNSRFNLGVDVSRTALHEAVKRDDQKTTLRLLEKGISPNIIDANGRAAIHHAIHKRNLEVFKALRADGNVDLQVKDTQEGGYSPFLFAVERKCYDILEDLITAKKEEIHFDDKDFYGNNLFHLLFCTSRVLIMKDGVKLLKLLFESCPEALKRQLLSEKNNNNKLPYEIGKEALQDYLYP